MIGSFCKKILQSYVAIVPLLHPIPIILTSSKNSLMATVNSCRQFPKPPLRRWLSPMLEVTLISAIDEFFTTLAII
jgi:hypothetical protein